MNFRFTSHTEQELLRRFIPRPLLERVLANPQQKCPASNGRIAYQSKLEFPGGKIYLLRAIVDERLSPAVVVTVYRTSKIEKYWRQS
jgi:hypothetical protein